MSSAAENVTDNSTHAHTIRPFSWTVRREIWEHRGLWMAPLSVAGLLLLGFLFQLYNLSALMLQADHLPPLPRTAAFAAPFAFTSAAIMMTGMVVSISYCLSALNNERRDRSILFWKSLPVSDTTAVLAKAFVPFVVVPVIVVGVAVATQIIMLALASLALTLLHTGASPIWSQATLARVDLTMLYTLATGVLWYAPIYGWLLMISSWARRAAFLWAVLPWLGLFILEKIALGTNYVGSFIAYRLIGAMQIGFNVQHYGNISVKTMRMINPLNAIAARQFFLSPGLWSGLVAAAALIAAAVWFRRMRDPG
jgi:ABC-2 type transport system permease protein